MLFDSRMKASRKGPLTKNEAVTPTIVLGKTFPNHAARTNRFIFFRVSGKERKDDLRRKIYTRWTQHDTTTASGRTVMACFFFPFIFFYTIHSEPELLLKYSKIPDFVFSIVE